MPTAIPRPQSHARPDDRRSARLDARLDTDIGTRRVLELSATEMRLFGVFFFAFFTGWWAMVAIPLPPDGVPMSLQSLAVILCALALGPKYGTASMLLYVLVGALGAPMFSGGGSGFAHLFGQTGGYILGFVVAQPIICWCVRRRDGAVRGWGGMILGVLLGHTVIFALGVPVLAWVRGFELERALQGGFYPFLPGLVIKSAIAVLIGRIAAPHAMRRIW